MLRRKVIKKLTKNYKSVIYYLCSLFSAILTMLIIPSSLLDNHAKTGLFFYSIQVIATYIRLLFLPINQNLDYDYSIYNSLMADIFFIF